MEKIKMRVISGECGGKNLIAPDGISTRPTTDRAKEGIFSSIQFKIPGAAVLDLFAGSGQMGLESLSRRASKCTFVDFDKNAVKAIKKNIQICKMESKSKVYNYTAESFIMLCNEKFDIIFLDPPYNMGILGKTILSVYDLLNEDGIIIAESEPSWQLNREIKGLREVKKYKYGHVLVTKFIREK
jgi:16S rRNA (guanine966-N2)-methyltransferase